MNQRIDELFEQALDEAVPETWNSLNPQQLSKLKTVFAQLVIKEMSNQEPVAWITPGQDLHLNNSEGFRFSDWTPLYTHPPRRTWQSLTEEEIATAAPDEPFDLDFAYARAIEAALKERNA